MNRRASNRRVPGPIHRADAATRDGRPRGAERGLGISGETLWRVVLPLAAWLLQGAAISAASPAETARSTATPIRFNRDIRPILSDHCFACHGPSEDRGGDLRLDVRAEAVAERSGDAAIVPGRPEASALIRRIASHDDDEVMPPPRSKKPRLSAAQIELLGRWIAEGAVYEGHWAFQPLAAQAPPDVPGSRWIRNPIDAFVEARLRAEGLTPSPEADRETLLRRAALDLVGLQPSPEELAAFLADRSPDAYDRAVDGLLASPHHGERWGRHWLDQARYADSNGYSIDSGRAMWPWRDWVIDAINRDLPFDRFTIEQLAGDLLPDATVRQRIATGFHRNTMINEEGGTKPEQFRCEAAVDRVNTTGAVWLGLTAGCAQCHSHKYDPLSQQEYYRLYAFFNSDADVNNTADTVEVLQGEVTGTPGEVSREELDAADSRLRDTRSRTAERLRGWLAAWPTATAEAGELANAWTPVGSEVAVPAKPRFTLDLPPLAEPAGAVKLRFPIDGAAGGDDAAKRPRAHSADGSFVVSEVVVKADGRVTSLLTALAPQANPALTIDGKRDTGLRFDAPPGGTQDAAVVVVPAEPLPAGTRLSIELEFAGGEQRIPRRLAVDATDDEPLAPLEPEALGILAAALRGRQAPTVGAPRAEQPPADEQAPEPPAEKDVLKAFAPVDLELHRAEFAREHLRRRATLGATLVMRMLPRPRETFLLRRGDYLDPDVALGPLAADTPAFLPPLRMGDAAAAGAATRLDLARWLVRPDNPLTPRVTVNRVWMRYFGTGLVETENDFGAQGGSPSHPELLDWLAAEFIRGGWSMKRLHRLIVTSATYRQASIHRADLAARDPRNVLLGRQNRTRLDAEVVRDSALAAAGILCRNIGGPSVHPPQPEGVYAFTQTVKKWPTETGPQRHRRSLYTMFYRSAPHPLFTTFDAPNFSTACTRRIASNTPLQSLMLANDPIFTEAAAAIGDRVVSGAVDAAPDRIDRLFLVCLARLPTVGERRAAEDFLAESRSEQAGDAPEPWAALARAVLNTDAFITRE